MSKRLTIEEFIETLKQGGSGGSSDMLVVNTVLDEDGITRLDKTWQEIHDAPGRVVIHDELMVSSGTILQCSTVDTAYIDGHGYLVIYSLLGRTHMVASSPDAYPVDPDSGGPGETEG